MNEYEKKDRGVGAGRIRCDRISHRKLRKDTLKTISHAAVALLLLTSLTIAQGQRSAPQPVPLPPAIQQPKDVPYPGVIRLEVDATDLAHRVYHIRETIPVASSGPMVLLYPQWI